MEILKTVLIILASILGVIAVGRVLLLIKINYENSKLFATETQELVPGIYSIKDDTFINMYIIRANNSLIAVDAASSPKNVAAELEKLNLDPKVSAVLLTHTDDDHVGAIKLFSKAKIYLSSEEEQMINGKTPRAVFFMRNKLTCPYEVIKDHQTIEIEGMKIQGILNPGHTPGSMSYIINDRYIFTGDTLSLKNGKAELSSDFYNMDSKTEGKSIGMLAGLIGPKYIFTAHSGYSDNFDEALSGWREYKG
jgi:glyoxylase-like metal-dependent hydrolase (beta-lactamase superfamily II)